MQSHVFTVNSDEYTAACSVEDFKVKIPNSKLENRRLKYGHVEDDNVDIAYLNFPVLRFSLVFTLISLTAFTAAVISAYYKDYKPISEEELIDNSIIIRYGSKPFRCKTFFKFPTDGLPSIMNLLELNVWGNVIFRFSTCLSIAIRFIHSLLFRNLLLNGVWKNVKSPMFRWFTDVMPMITIIESCALSIFSIVTMHSDFKEVNHFCKSIFVVAGLVNMFIPTVFHFMICMSSSKFIDTLLLLVRALCTTIFAYFGPQYFKFHIGWTKDSLCHSYVPRYYAFMEYGVVLSYLIFHVLSLIDLSKLQLICYPRTCGGECEPLDPMNFEPGSKYEHCRAFEYNQRRLARAEFNTVRF